MLSPCTGLKCIVFKGCHACSTWYLVPKFRLGLWERFHHLFCNFLLMWWTSKSTIQLVRRRKEFYSTLKRSSVIKVLWFHFFPLWCSYKFTVKHYPISPPVLQFSHINCTDSYDHTSCSSSRKSGTWWLSSGITPEEMLAIFWNMVDLFTLCRFSYLIIFPLG